MIQSMRSGQPLQSLDLHYYQSNPNYQNILGLEIVSVGIPSYSNLIINYITHVHPIHPQFGPLPFIILNKKHYITGERIQSFFMGVLADLLQKMQVEQQMNGQQRNKMSDVSYSAILLQLTPVYRICYELSMVIDQFSDRDLNDYYTLISPWKKYQYSCYLQQRRNQLDKIGYYIDSSNKLNQQYFQTKIQELKVLVGSIRSKRSSKIQKINHGEVIEQMQESQPEDKCQLVIQDWIWMYVDMFLKLLKKRNKKLYEALQKDPMFNQQKIQKMRQNQKERKRQLFTNQKMLGSFNIINVVIETENLKKQREEKKKKQEKEKNKDQYTKLMKQNQEFGFWKAMVLPILVNMVFWTGWKVLRTAQ